MQYNKAPGSDGFCVEFYKMFSSQLTSLLISMFNYFYEQSELPSSLTEALITVFLKPGKDELDCSS